METKCDSVKCIAQNNVHVSFRYTPQKAHFGVFCSYLHKICMFVFENFFNKKLGSKTMFSIQYDVNLGACLHIII